MTSIGKKLDDYYRRLGSRGLLLVLFAAALTVNIIFSLRLSLPAAPEEFGTAAWSAYFSGFSDIAGRDALSAPLSSGWLAGFLYAPFYYLFDNPVIRYRSMLIMNSLLAAFIPLLTFKIAAALGLEKAWQRTLCAVIAGAAPAVFAYTKSISPDMLRVFLPFLSFWLFIKCTDVKFRAIRFFLSLFAAVVLAFAPAADPRMWFLVTALILLVLYSRFILRVKSVMFPVFFPSLAALTVLQVYINERLTGEFFTRNAVGSIPYVESLYSFAVSTWGVGVLAVILCVFAFRQKDSLLKAFAFFALVYNASMFFNGSAAILLIFFAFCYIFKHGLDFSVTTLAAITFSIIIALYYYASSSFTIAEVSAVFCVIALLFVLVSCAERYRRHIISFCLSLVLLFSGIAAVPNQAVNPEALEISEFIYNSADAPPTYIIDYTELAPLLRFLNRSTTIKTAEDFSGLPEDCFIFMRGRDGAFIFIAHGERAQAYLLSQEE